MPPPDVPSSPVVAPPHPVWPLLTQPPSAPLRAGVALSPERLVRTEERQLLGPKSNTIHIVPNGTDSGAPITVSVPAQHHNVTAISLAVYDAYLSPREREAAPEDDDDFPPYTIGSLYIVDVSVPVGEGSEVDYTITLPVSAPLESGGGACKAPELFTKVDDNMTCIAGCCVPDDARQQDACACSGGRHRGLLCEVELQCASVDLSARLISTHCTASHSKRVHAYSNNNIHTTTTDKMHMYMLYMLSYMLCMLCMCMCMYMLCPCPCPCRPACPCVLAIARANRAICSATVNGTQLYQTCTCHRTGAIAVLLQKRVPSMTITLDERWANKLDQALRRRATPTAIALLVAALAWLGTALLAWRYDQVHLYTRSPPLWMRLPPTGMTLRWLVCHNARLNHSLLRIFSSLYGHSSLTTLQAFTAVTCQMSVSATLLVLFLGARQCT